jgi:hypothetical protein
MPANKNWPRWIFASISDHFKAAAAADNVPLLIEGIEDRTSDKIRQLDHAELRINGPVTKNPSKDYYILNVTVNIILQNYMSEENAYTIIQNAGVFYEAMGPIDVFKYGNGPDDDGSFLGCLVLREDLVEPRFVAHFGQLKEDTRIRESMVGGKYQICLQN